MLEPRIAYRRPDPAVERQRARPETAS